MYDNQEIATLVEQFKPQILIAGYSAYCHHYDYEQLAKIAHANGAYLMADMAHISGLVSGGVAPNLFDYCDIVTTTTHKSLQCNRGALIFFRKGEKRNLSLKSKPKEVKFYDLEQRINDSVFPSHQGGPHMHTIAGVGVGLGLANTPAFKKY
jgi:glycine hydroxymethyltransferase